LSENEEKNISSSQETTTTILAQHLQQFQPSDEARVIGPSVFPKPTQKIRALLRQNHDNHDDDDDVEIVVALKPVLGQHRPDHDAVVLFAAEYSIHVYAQFIESLRATGYDGDIVLSVHPNDLKKDDIDQYLSYYANGRGVVVYAPQQVCYTRQGEETESANGGGRTCHLHQVYGKKRQTSNNNTGDDDDDIEPLPDARGPRTLQNIRYEIYWAMVAPYHGSSWILLVDARDTIFQTNPFANVPRRTDPTGRSGLLYLFGESIEATNIGKSAQYNYRWIRQAYGVEVADALADKPIICSGATMGETVAIETYLRAMVAEADETGTVLMGSDQGFHNRLYYSQKLANADSIHDIVVFDQGAGIVNNLAALRSKPLEEWGNGKLVEKTANGGGFVVKNWDGTISPVVHQFDRHKDLARYFSRIKGRQDYQRWKSQHGQSTAAER